jgi:hypothetical protein
MIRETELNLFVPSPELLVRLASGERPLGVRAGPPRIRVLRETYFDTPELALRQRGMTCKLRQGEGEAPSVVVTVGEGPDSEGITSRSRLTASAVGFGVFETLRGNSEPAAQIRKFVDPDALRPNLAVDIQRLGRALRTRFLRRPILLLFFDRITVQAGRSTSVLHEIRIRRRWRGGPLIRDLAQRLRDEYHLFPDGMSTLQRAQRVLAMEGKSPISELSPYALSLALALFRDGEVGLVERGDVLRIPSFRGSGEDAARALLADLTAREDQEILRLGTTEPREGGHPVELWAAQDPPRSEGEATSQKNLIWYPWHQLLEDTGRGNLQDPDLLPALLLLTRRRLLGQLSWIPPHDASRDRPTDRPPHDPAPGESDDVGVALEAGLNSLRQLRRTEDRGASLEDRLAAVGTLSRELAALFRADVQRVKERILSEEETPDAEFSPQNVLDLISVRIRGITDRLYQVVNDDLLPGLEAENIHVRQWSGLMHEDRRALLEVFSERFLPSMKVAADWGPALIPEMPPSGCALGLTVRAEGSEATRFFHVVLDEETPSFIPVPESTVVLPLEEVIRGYLYSRFPDLERAECYLFRFRTAEVTVKEEAPNPEFRPGEVGLGAADEAHSRAGSEGTATVESPGGLDAPETRETPVPPTILVDSKQTVVVRVKVHQRMPEAHQAQLLRALERQVARRTPLIGWSDLYPVSGPMDLSGLPDLLKLRS